MFSSLPLRKIQGLQPAPPGDVWPFTIPSVRSILEDELIFAPITVIVGENGAGKSVLLESVAEAFGFPLEGGSLAEQRESIEGKSPLGGLPAAGSRSFTNPRRSLFPGRDGAFVSGFSSKQRVRPWQSSTQPIAR